MARFEAALAVVLEHEGGFVDSPADPGGATNGGLSLRQLVKEGLKWDIDGDGDVDRDDIEALTLEDKVRRYRRHWQGHRYALINSQPVANKVMDLSIWRARTEPARSCREHFGPLVITWRSTASSDPRRGPPSIASTRASYS